MAYLNTPLLRFFTASLAMHLCLLLLWAKPSIRVRPQESISVSLLPPPPPEESKSKPSPAPRDAPRRPSKAPAKIAKKNSPLIPEKTAIPIEKSVIPRELPAQKEPTREEAPPPLRERIPDKAIVAERPLPTLKELLPPVGWSADARVGSSDGPIPLETKNPQFVTYFNSIKRAIEVVWQYPELALRYGLQGRLLLEFSILGNGDLDSAKIVRSSGSNLLDEEALRAVKAAAPFGPIPPWLGKNRIDIVASFEYLDNRLNYRFMR
ncbi:MAG TPA: energy transducer TonB [Candidatus Binatia bacterium]|nr:energy transducer TonB [Candidatus Binatia bacterium]